MRKLVAVLALIIFSATIVIGFSQIRWANENNTISVDRIEVRTGNIRELDARPLPYKNMFYNLIDSLAWYRPSSGATSVTTHYFGSYSNYQPPGRRVFYTQGRIWIIFWWASGTSGNIYYTSSADGVTWATPTDTGFRCNRPPVAYFDGTYVHIAYQRGDPGYYYLCYVRGTPSSSGSISFGSVQNAIATSSNYIPTSIIVDSNGYPWIGYRYSSDASNWYPYVTKSSKNDGTWTTASGFPYQLSTYADVNWLIELAPLTSGKIAAIYTSIARSVYVKSWTGSAWNSEVSSPWTFSSSYTNPWVSAVAVEDTVYIAYPKSSTNRPALAKHDYSSNSFTFAVDLDSTGMSGGTGMICYDMVSNLIYFVTTYNGLNYKVFNTTSNSIGNFILISSDSPYALGLSVPYKRSSSSEPVFVVYDVGSSDPRTIKFAWILNSPQTQFQVSVTNLQVSGKYVKSKTSGLLDSANVTVKIYHNVDSNSTWVLAGKYNLANDTLLPYSSSFTTPWYSLLSGAFTQGTHTYYVKVEITVQAWDAISGTTISSTAYTICSMPLEWKNVATLGQLQITETNMHEVWNVPLYVIALVLLVSIIAYVRLREERE